VFPIEFINQIAPYIQKYAPSYGIRVYSPIIAQAVLESASGTSELAANAHNYFGLKYRAGRCPTACGIYHKIGSEQNNDGSYSSSPMQWMKFPDMESGVQGYFDFTDIPAYSNLKEVTDPLTYLENIKKDGYATSLQYVENLMNVIHKYDLTKYDTPAAASNPVCPVIRTLSANPANYGGSRAASSVRYLVYHYTANKTDKAKSNAAYFKNNIVKASAHYFVDEHDIYRSVEDLKTAYSVGGRKWSDCTSTGGGSMYGKITNTNSISIEMCSSNGEILEATLQNAVRLGKELMQKYHIPLSNVYRHFDVNGKHCPGWDGWYGKDSAKWNEFRSRLSGAASDSNPSNSQASDSQVSGSHASDSQSSGSHASGSSVSGSHASDSQSSGSHASGSSVSGSHASGSSTSGSHVSGGSSAADSGIYQVKLLEHLNVRKSPNGKILQVNGAKKGFIYTIVETQGNWGRLKSGAGWISVSDKYVKKL